MIANGATVKFNTNGQVAWAAPYTGNDVAVDTNGNVYVTGFSTTEYATVKLDSTGSNLWVRMYSNGDAAGVWPTVSQKVTVDNAGQVYVAGWEAWGAAFPCNAGQTNQCRYFRPSVLMYDATGSCVWTNSFYFGSGSLNWGQTVAIIPDNQSNVYVTANTLGGIGGTARISIGGQVEWGQTAGPNAGVSGMAIDTNGNAYLTGGPYVTFKLISTNGEVAWYVNSSSGTANAIALDNSANIYVTGFTNAGVSSSDWETVKCDKNGNQQWVIRYNGPANGNDGANAITVAPDGSIYVTGYSANANGGTDITTIKYGNLTNLQKKSDGSIQLQFFGTPGQNYNFQATTNFMSWNNLGSSPADTNGILEFLDTNAPLFPSRFYRWSSPSP